MKMAVAQAGAEVKTLGGVHDKWLQDTDARMAPLLQAQTSSMSTQKALAQVRAVINNYHDNAKEKAQAVLNGMITASEEALTFVAFISWKEYVRRVQREGEIQEDYQQQLEGAQSKLIAYKESQLQSVRHVLMSGVEENKKALVAQCFAALVDEVRQAKFTREHEAEVEELQTKTQIVCG